MADRTFCRACNRWVGGGLSHQDGCPAVVDSYLDDEAEGGDSDG